MEKTIEVLISENAEFEARVKELIESLEAQGGQVIVMGEEIETLKTALEEAKSQVLIVTTERDEALQQLAELHEVLSAKTAKHEPQVFEHAGEKFEIVVPKINIPGVGTRTALEVIADDESSEDTENLKSKLIASESGAIRKID